MATVKFANTCDFMIAEVKGKPEFCNVRSEKYGSWPRCRVCLNDICPAHMQLDSLRSADIDSPATVICLNCEEE